MDLALSRKPLINDTYTNQDYIIYQLLLFALILVTVCAISFLSVIGLSEHSLTEAEVRVLSVLNCGPPEDQQHNCACLMWFVLHHMCVGF